MILPITYKMKPSVAARLIRGYPLARDLVCCYLMNEGSGTRLFDLSGNNNNGTFAAGAASPSWIGGRFGPALSFAGDDYFTFSSNITFSGAYTIAMWFYVDAWDANYRMMISRGPSGTYEKIGTSNDMAHFLVRSKTSGASDATVSLPSTGAWHFLTLTRNSLDKVDLYIDAGPPSRLYGDAAQTGNAVWGAIGYSVSQFWNGTLDNVLLCNRALSAQEIRQLYLDQFAMFNRPGRAELMYVPTTAVVSLAGTSSGESGASGSIGLTRRLAGSASAHTAASGEIGVAGESPVVAPQRTWLKEALFAGMTANAFKLGTTLSLGWFWMRVEGCSALYRGGSMSCIEFESILSVGNPDAGFISPPGCIPHDSSSTYFYVVRRFNRCGIREDTLAGAVKVSIDANGDLAAPQPNSIFSSTAAAEGDKVRLTWFYSPLEQKSGPMHFNIYCDSRIGEIDYESPIAVVSHKGRRFYSYKSGALTEGRYLFAIRAQDIDGAENGSLGPLRVQVSAASPDAIDIVSVEAV